ncbi:MAG: DUF4912 domain-containing protein [Polyangiaceae bacterium]
MQRKDLEGLSRDELIAKAEALGVVRPRALTIPELIDEILKASAPAAEPRAPRGWFGRARDLLTSVIDRGLGRPEAKRRGDRQVAGPPPLPTVTLAEIYAAQGHLERAITTLDEVLAKEPGHTEAEALRTRFIEQLRRTKPSTPPPVIEANPEPIGTTSNALGALDAVAESEEELGGDATNNTASTEAPAASESARTDVDAAEVPAPATAATTADDEAPQAGEAAVEPSAAADALAQAAVAAAEDALEGIDDVVAIATEPHAVYLYWEVRADSLATARASQPEPASDSGLVIRVATVRAGHAAPDFEVRDVRVDALTGELFVRDLPAGANVRVSVGFKSGGVFTPFAVAAEIATPRVEPSSRPAEVFRRFNEAQPLARPDDPLARALATHRPSFGGPEASPPLRQESLVSRFPAGVWAEPAQRLVVTASEGARELPEAEPVELPREPATHGPLRAGGSSDLFRPAGDLFRPSGAWASNTTGAPPRAPA